MEILKLRVLLLRQRLYFVVQVLRTEWWHRCLYLMIIKEVFKGMFVWCGKMLNGIIRASDERGY